MSKELFGKALKFKNKINKKKKKILDKMKTNMGWERSLDPPLHLFILEVKILEKRFIADEAKHVAINALGRERVVSCLLYPPP